MSARSARTGRSKFIAAIHAEANSQGIEEDDRRALMARVTGKDSCSKMNEAELGRVLGALKGRSSGAGRAALPDNAYGAKLRALWISAYWLGVVEDRTDAALAAFIKRQTGLDSARFLHAPEDAEKAIEAIKSWLGREAGVSWETYRDAHGKAYEDPRARVIETQWRRLAEIGAVKIADDGALSWWLVKALKLPGYRGATQIADKQKDEAIRKLGAWLRRELQAT